MELPPRGPGRAAAWAPSGETRRTEPSGPVPSPYHREFGFARGLLTVCAHGLAWETPARRDGEAQSIRAGPLQQPGPGVGMAVE